MRKFFKAIEDDRINVRSNKDGRKRVNLFIVSYIGEDGHEYRKSHELPVGPIDDKVIEFLRRDI